MIVLDDLETLDAPPGPLRAYVELAARVVASGGGSLFAGALLRPLGGRLVEVLVSTHTAGRMFATNLEEWRTTALEHQLADRAELDELAEELRSLAGSPRAQNVRWVLRQLVVRS